VQTSVSTSPYTSCLSIWAWLLSLTFALAGRAQEVPIAYTSPQIGAVRLHPEGAPLGGPFLELGGEANLVLKYDDLTGDWPNHEWTMVHCNADWSAFSDLTHWDYMEGWPDELDNVENSFGGVVPFAHVQTPIPSRDLRPTRTGNYLLIVHQSGDPDDVVIMRRFVVYRRQADVTVSFRRPIEAGKIPTHQRLDISVELPPGHRWNNPMRDIQVSVLQNGAWPWAAHQISAGQMRGDVLLFNQDPQLTFSGGDRWRSADLKSLAYTAKGIERIIDQREEGETVSVQLTKDASRRFSMLGSRPDLKGSFSVHNDRFDDVELTSDYLDVRFALDHKDFGSVPEVYVFGALSGWALDPAFKMTFDPEENAFFMNALLKQGWYDYRYVATLPSEPGFTFEGAHSGTANRYHIFVHAPAPDGTDMVIGFDASDLR
jgi:hypothetical protein